MPGMQVCKFAEGRDSDRGLAEFRQFFSEALASGGTLVAIDSKVGRIIGSSRFHTRDSERSEVEIGWTFLARSHGVRFTPVISSGSCFVMRFGS